MATSVLPLIFAELTRRPSARGYEQKLKGAFMSTKRPTLTVVVDEQVVFQSFGKWLHPLFELEDHLSEHCIDLKHALLVDKVVGKAAALLMIHLGAGKVHGLLMSKLAMRSFEHYGIPYSFDHSIERIQCQTELILEAIDEPEEAYQILRKRAQRD
ncbi:MAG: DUF1893 domain-containing protein [Chloroflexi bacterium]|nr:DUF1893 domain-containing protein [Chloroflexota bacterium]